VSGVAVHRPLMAENVVPVITVFTTGTEGHDEMLRDMNLETPWRSEMLLTPPAGGAVFVSSVALYECFRFCRNSARLVQRYLRQCNGGWLHVSYHL